MQNCTSDHFQHEKFLKPTRKWCSGKVQVLFSGQSAAQSYACTYTRYAGATIQSATMFSCMRPAAIVKHSITQLCREQRSCRGSRAQKNVFPYNKPTHRQHRAHNLAPVSCMVTLQSCTVCRVNEL